jgi:hypothetical protein
VGDAAQAVLNGVNGLMDKDVTKVKLLLVVLSGVGWGCSLVMVHQLLTAIPHNVPTLHRKRIFTSTKLQHNQ